MQGVKSMAKSFAMMALLFWQISRKTERRLKMTPSRSRVLCSVLPYVTKRASVRGVVFDLRRPHFRRLLYSMPVVCWLFGCYLKVVNDRWCSFGCCVIWMLRFWMFCMVPCQRGATNYKVQHFGNGPERRQLCGRITLATPPMPHSGIPSPLPSTKVNYCGGRVPGFAGVDTALLGVVISYRLTEGYFDKRFPHRLHPASQYPSSLPWSWDLKGATFTPFHWG